MTNWVGAIAFGQLPDEARECREDFVRALHLFGIEGDEHGRALGSPLMQVVRLCGQLVADFLRADSVAALRKSIER